MKALSTCRTENSAWIHPQGLELPIPASALPLKDLLAYRRWHGALSTLPGAIRDKDGEKVQEEEKETVAGIQKKKG